MNINQQLLPEREQRRLLEYINDYQHQRNKYVNTKQVNYNIANENTLIYTVYKSQIGIKVLLLPLSSAGK